MRLIFTLLLALPLSSLASQLVTVEYRDKPPYSYTEGGKPRGFLLERTVAIFRRANVPAVFAEVPVKRITADIQANLRPICSPSWYKLPEREAYARFSLAIHQDKPHVVLAAPHAVAAVRKHRQLSSLFADASLTAGVVEGVSYGAELDALINGAAKPPMRAVVAPLQLARMLASRRADFMLIDQEDLAYLNEHSELSTLGLVRIELTGMPAGLKRYLMCSKQLDAATLARLDQAIRILLPGLNP